MDWSTAAVSSPQHKGVAGLRKGHAVAKLAMAVPSVIGDGAKASGVGGNTSIALGQGALAASYSGVLAHF